MVNVIGNDDKPKQLATKKVTGVTITMLALGSKILYVTEATVTMTKGYNRQLEQLSMNNIDVVPYD